jgi:UDP-N-acetylmuramoyl-L-alanyl-D-glutamate--2,6-diaminopimelate ligase
VRALAGPPRGPVLVLGAARAGQAALAALERVGAGPLRVWDEDESPLTRERVARLRSEGIDAHHGPWRDVMLDDPEPALVIKSPGITPAAAPVAAALARGLPVVDELELGVELSRRDLIAVTGTDGKSTTCAFLSCVTGEELPLAGNTEFGEPLSALSPDGGPVVVEVSSYQLEFTRCAFPRLAVLTALSEEHLQRHGTMERYAAAKRRLFLGDGAVVPAAVVNADGPFGRALAADLAAAGAAVATVGTRHGADYRVLDVVSALRSAEVRARTPAGEAAISLATPGRHNAENALAALAAGDLLGVPQERVLAALPSVPGVPGRWEVVDSPAPVDFVVDFAHTPNAMRRVLGCARDVLASRPGASLHVVMSAGGITSMAKRRRYGRAAGDLADRVVVTEGSVSEVPQAEIIGVVAEAARRGGAAVTPEPDRHAAIARAVADAEPGDLVMAVGHGARAVLYSDLAGTGRPFEDRAVARDALAARFGA